MKYASVVVLAAAMAALAGVSLAHDPQAHVGHGTFSAGEPGDPNKPARTIEVIMDERGGRMLFVPENIVVKRGEQVRFVLRNEGGRRHEFLLATTTENLRHAEEMKKNPGMEHDDPNGRDVRPGETGEIVWRFTKRGEFEFACLIPGHREAGMFGKVVVR